MIRPAAPTDVPILAGLIHELAVYERLVHRLDLDESRLHDHLFGPRPYCEALIAEDAGTAVGYALFFPSYSSFLARPGIYLEDLFVLPAFRGRGYGKALLVELARLAVARECSRVEWAVLNWNAPAIGFYQSIGAIPMDEWTAYRLSDRALTDLAAAT